MKRLALTLILLLVSQLFAEAQSWTNVLATSRAIDWTKAGLPPTLPTGETTTNPWTPPTRTQCGSTVNPSGLTNATDTNNINAAIAACSSGGKVVLAAGTFTITGTVQMYYQFVSSPYFGFTLAGQGPQSTIVNMSGGGKFQFGIAWTQGDEAVTGGLSQGSTAVTMAANTSGGGLVAGMTVQLMQCNTGLTGALGVCGSGTQTDNGGVFVCAFDAACSQQTTGANKHAQTETFYVTSVTGSGPYTVNLDHGIRLANWSTGQNAYLEWIGSKSGGGLRSPHSTGLENMTINATGSSANQPVEMTNVYADWMKGVRLLGIGTSYALNVIGSKNVLITNNYIDPTTALNNADNTTVGTGGSADVLILNNIIPGGVPWEGEGANSGVVVAYNASRWGNTSYCQNSMFEHHEGTSFLLYEGNQLGKINEDDTWGTGGLNSMFRNFVNGCEYGFTTGSMATAFGLSLGAFRRFDNLIGNAVGYGAILTNYQSTIASPQSTPAFQFSPGSPTDTLTQTTSMRWGNCDTVTNTCRNQSSEVPTTLSGNAVPYQNTVPGNNNLPCSFFLPSFTSTTCAGYPSGGTGLSFWKVCTSWSSFPTSCSGYTTKPFPAVGPDVTGGTYVNGTAYDNAAMVAHMNLPIDTTYQNSYSITGSSWIGGVMTLTISGLPTSTHIIGGFSISGGPCAGGEYVMTASSSTTVSYAVTPNPGSCQTGGTMKFPNIRQFDERVYQADSSGGAGTGKSSGGKITKGGKITSN